MSKSCKQMALKQNGKPKMDKIAGINDALRRYYHQSHAQVSEDLIDAILYSIDSGGKRIRPLILLEVLEGFGISLSEAHFAIAAGLEMIHTGSLIHDDLPAMDDDDYRRGRLTNHKVFGEATAILAGDSLFLDPFDLIASVDLPAKVLLRLIQLLAVSSGTFGMVGGQMLDMTSEGKVLTVEQLAAIHTNKTGRLLTFPFAAAGILAGEDEAVIGKLHLAGSLVGHAFQVRDDILDVTSSFETIGKTPQKDLLAEKATYPSLLGLEESYQVLDDSLDRALAIFEGLEQERGLSFERIRTMIEELRLHG